MKKLELDIPQLPYNLEEAMNRFRINIKFSGKHVKKLMIASSIPNEGKSFIAVYLWKMLAEIGAPTVLVDADLRKSMIYKDYHYQFQEELKGIDYYLSGLSEQEEIIYETNISNGYIVPVSNHLENPSTLLEDQRMEQLLKDLSEKYRFVIVDTPPLQSLSDGSLIASMCDAAILVVRGSVTSRKIVKESLRQIEQAECKLLGTVLNRVHIHEHSYYYEKYGKYYTKDN